MTNTASSPPPEIDGLFMRLKNEMCCSMPAVIGENVLHEKIDAFREVLKKATQQRNNEVITVMGMRIEQFLQNTINPESPDADRQIRMAHQIFNTRRIVYEALIDEWNENRWIYSKGDLVRRAIFLLKTHDRQQEILSGFTATLPDGRILQPSPAQFKMLIDKSIEYLQQELL